MAESTGYKNKYEHLLGVFTNYVYNDLEATESAYVKDALYQAGATQADVKALALDDLITLK